MKRFTPIVRGLSRWSIEVVYRGGLVRGQSGVETVVDTPIYIRRKSGRPASLDDEVESHEISRKRQDVQLKRYEDEAIPSSLASLDR